MRICLSLDRYESNAPIVLPHTTAGKGLSAQTLARYGVVLTTYATMALEAPRREGAAGQKGGKKPVPPGAAAAAAAGAAGSAWGEEDGMVDLVSDSEEAGPSLAQPPAAKRQKGAGGKAAAGGGGGRSKEAGPLHQIYWHRWAVMGTWHAAVQRTPMLGSAGAWDAHHEMELCGRLLCHSATNSCCALPAVCHQCGWLPLALHWRGAAGRGTPHQTVPMLCWADCKSPPHKQHAFSAHAHPNLQGGAG